MSKAETLAMLAHLSKHLAHCAVCPCLQLWKLTQMAPSVLIGILAGACWSNDVRVAKSAVQALASVTHCLLAAGAECVLCTREMLVLHAGSKTAGLLTCSALTDVGIFLITETPTQVKGIISRCHLQKPCNLLAAASITNWAAEIGDKFPDVGPHDI